MLATCQIEQMVRRDSVRATEEPEGNDRMASRTSSHVTRPRYLSGTQEVRDQVELWGILVLAWRGLWHCEVQQHHPVDCISYNMYSTVPALLVQCKYTCAYISD